MIDDSDFEQMAPKDWSTDTIYVHQCFSSLFSGMLNWIGNVLYPRFRYKVITTYDKAVEVFTKKKQNPDGQTQAPFLPALTLDPVLDFSNEERAGRFPWMFKNLVNKGGKLWNKIRLSDQGVCITPMFTRYQGTVEVTGWFTSMYELIDFRTILIQYCNGYQRWIRPERFSTHLILPKEIIEMDAAEGKVDWHGINPEIITLTTTNTQEYALPFKLDAIWRLDSFSDATNKMGADQIAEYKCQANFTWECNIPTFIRVENYRYPIQRINLNVGLTPTDAVYPVNMSYDMYTKLNLYDELVPFSRQMNIWNIIDDKAIPCIKLQDDMAYTYPKIYQTKYNHYVRGKVIDIEKIYDENDIKSVDSILIIEKYKDEYLPYIRRCKGLVSRFDGEKSYNLMTIVRDYHISFIGDLQDEKIFTSFKKLHDKEVTFDVLGKVVYKGILPIKCYGPTDDFSHFVFNHNIIRMIKEFALKKNLEREYRLSWGQTNLTTKITDKDNVICEQFTADENNYEYRTKHIINSNCFNNFHVKINGEKIDKDCYTINNFNIVFDRNKITLKTGDIISLLRDTDCVITKITQICVYKMTKDDEVNYYKDKKYITLDISNVRTVDPSTIQCISYNGLMNQTIDFVVDPDKKIIVFKLEPHRDAFIQIFGSPA